MNATQKNSVSVPSLKKTLRGQLVVMLLLTLVGVAFLTLTSVAWMKYDEAQDNLKWTRDQIRSSLNEKGTGLVDNHALALRGLVLDNAFGDMRDVVDRAVSKDDDVVYGLLLSSNLTPWAYSGPDMDADTPIPDDVLDRLKIDTNQLTVRTLQIRQIQLFNQGIYEFSMPVVGDESELLGTILYGISSQRTQKALATARKRSERDLYRTMGLLGLIVLVAMLFGFLVVVRQAKRITHPLLVLTKAANAIASGKRDERPDIRSGDEIELLAGAFNQMITELNVSYNTVATAKEKLERLNETLEAQVAERTAELRKAVDDLWGEMDLARKIQTVLLPEKAPLSECFVAATMVPADQVGGDYYDMFKIGDADWILIGDVSGHGVTAGLTMMMVQTAVRSITMGCTMEAGSLMPAGVLGRVNHAVIDNLNKVNPYQYMTISALRFKDNHVTYSGLHEDIFVYRAKSKTIETIETRGMWIGILDDISDVLENETFEVFEDDIILLYTDGLTETVVGENNYRLSSEGVVELFGKLASKSKDVHKILDGIMNFMEGHEAQDDITVLVVRYAPGQNNEGVSYPPDSHRTPSLTA